MRLAILLVCIGFLLTVTGCGSSTTNTSSKSPSSSSSSSVSSSSKVSSSSNSSYSVSEKKNQYIQMVKSSFGSMATKAYFNSEGTLVVEVNNEWNYMTDGEKKDIIYVLKKQLSSLKKDMGEKNVDGYGMIVSTSGRTLETFYTN